MSTAILLESPHIQSSYSPIRTSFLSSEAYVVGLASLPAHYAASASSPSNTIDIFDKTTLQGVNTLAGHENATTCIKAVDSISGNNNRSLISSGRDGSIKVWDERTGSHSIKMMNLGKTRALLCCDVSSDGLTVAGGTDMEGDDALILYWDPRQPATPIRTHASTHADDITTLHFLPQEASAASHKVLLSASSDGLVCTSNADEDDEDEAVLHVGNWGTSISQAGWVHSRSSAASIWAASDMETFSTWSNELDQLQSLDIREPSVHHQGRTWVTDYLISCQGIPNSDPGLGVFVGSNEGDVALLSNSDLSVPGAPWTLHKLWTNGHTGIVRSLLWDEQNHILVTGGEDSKINVWSDLPVDIDAAGDDSAAMEVDASPSRKRDMDWQDNNEYDGKRARR